MFSDYVRSSLENLTSHVKSSPALINNFYVKFGNSRFNEEQLKVFVLNYGEFVRLFPMVLRKLIQVTTDSKAKLEYEKTLKSEMGNGDPERVHYKLLVNFFNDLAKNMNLKPKSLDHRQLRLDLKVLEETRALVEGEVELYTNKSRAVSAGAQLAQEYQAYGMLTNLYEMARNYSGLWPDIMEFHESAEYFYAHLGEAEKHHRVEALTGAIEQIESEKDLQDAIEGYHQHLNLIGSFWNRLAEEVHKQTLSSNEHN